MREHQSVIGQSVGHHIVLAVDVVHRPMNTALSKGVTEGDASAKMWPQIGRAACSLPAAKHYQLLAIFTEIEQKSVQNATSHMKATPEQTNTQRDAKPRARSP